KLEKRPAARARAYINRAAAYLRFAEYQKALDDYDNAIRLDPFTARWYMLRALAHAMLGHGPQAKADRDQAIALDPTWAKQSPPPVPKPLPEPHVDPELKEAVGQP